MNELTHVPPDPALFTPSILSTVLSFPYFFLFFFFGLSLTQKQY